MIDKPPNHLQEKLDMIPAEPGVYCFYDAQGTLLYVGKAALLRHRVRQYFQQHYRGHNAVKRAMIDAIADITWEKTKSEIDALVREAQLIKECQPKYNVTLRDDKNYFWVVFTNDIAPRIHLTHQPFDFASNEPIDAHARYSALGPFTDGRSLKKVLRLLRSVFPYCTCKDNHDRPCLNAQMQRCLGICCVHPSDATPEQREQYRSNIRAIRRVLLGRSTTLLRDITTTMEQAAKQKKFERAAQLRDQRDALENILHHSHVLGAPLVQRPRRHRQALAALQHLLQLSHPPQRIEAYDVANLKSDAPTASMVVAENGRLNPNAYRQFHLFATENDVAGIRETLERRLNHGEWSPPDLILVDGGIPQYNAARAVLEATNHNAIPVVALAKRDEILHTPISTTPIRLADSNTDAAYLLQRLRDEAHRFARRLHHHQRSKTLTK